MFLYHYYDKTIGPFKNLSDLDREEADKVLQQIAITKPNVQCAKRSADYMQARAYYENILRTEFQKKGGYIQRQVPHYMVVEHSPYVISAADWVSDLGPEAGADGGNIVFCGTPDALRSCPESQTGKYI